MLSNLLCIAAVLVGTWNLKWFPSGRAEHRAAPEVENAAIASVAAEIGGRLAKRGGAGAVVFLEEVRGEQVVGTLLEKIGDTNLHVAVVSAFRDFDGRLGWQQIAILTDLPVVESRYSYWKRTRKTLPPRGYAFALLDGGKEGLIACYGVHLKSNYGANSPEVRETNRLKREMCTQQLVMETKRIKSPDGRQAKRIVVAGDFNFDPWNSRFKGERTIAELEEAGFVGCFAGVAPEERATHPGRGTWASSTLDFIFVRGMAGRGTPDLSPFIEASDHRAVWWTVK